LPGREHEDAGEVVVVPRQLLLGEEAADVLSKRRAGPGVDEKKVFESRDVEEDGLVVEEELCEEG
jgi:hypothetical protein